MRGMFELTTGALYTGRTTYKVGVIEPGLTLHGSVSAIFTDHAFYLMNAFFSLTGTGITVPS